MGAAHVLRQEAGVSLTIIHLNGNLGRNAELRSSGNVDPRLLRVSIGVEGLEDLKSDLAQGLEALL
jgi:cystathionine beta-lyase/cystathionine gamma-synthase